MSLLSEIALTPDVFTEAGYSSKGLCDLALAHLRPVLLEETLVRDLRDGEWSLLFAAGNGLHPAGTELVKDLVTARRLIPAAAELPTEPGEPAEWAYEALASHRRVALSAVVVGASVAESLGEDATVCCAERVHTSAWWMGRSNSARLRRQTQCYLEILRPVL